MTKKEMEIKIEETYKKKLEKIDKRNRAGRKSKMTEKLTVNIYKLRKENMSIRKISEKSVVSIGLVHKTLYL